MNTLNARLICTMCGVVLFTGVALCTPVASALELTEHVHRYTPENGLRVIMVVRDYAPIISFQLMFDAGGIDEPDGFGGIAHMVEHMAFMGTSSIGSLDIEKELFLLERIEEAADAYFGAVEEELPREEIERLEQEFLEARKEAQELAEPNVLARLFDRHGGRNYNAYTGYDFTSYVITLPANRLQLFARIKADFMLDAVFRFFYEEVDVVKEERRQRNEDDPTGYLMEKFLDKAFQVHPYGRPLIGSMEEISRYRKSDALDFWKERYYPNRAVFVMVGDLKPDEDLRIIEKYFGVILAGPEKAISIPQEPKQESERRLALTYDAEPQILIGFHTPTYPERDAYVLDTVSALLGRGRTSRLYRRLVTEDRLVLGVSTSNAFPGSREPNQLVIHATPRYPHGPEEVEEAIYEEIEILKRESVSEWELQKIKNQVRASYIRSLKSSSGLAHEIAYYELFLGGWEKIMEYPEIINSVTAEEVQKCIDRYMHESNRTVAILTTHHNSVGLMEMEGEILLQTP